ncbi:PAS domain S-box-containing protein/diguanylate cyclase (GGDEF)-like protein [Pseudorhodoferax soli]|uniref:PAS domain S-box-containing protein/diguanylate cyclase (GGDEF)-like protein n=2 Tax=Pseudorhodoferax soli TaxID=545864 RepID=A0A368X5W8_9BURK|nr:PAS domain S-box-containing protein/diguanylate cyclase (GGDEF)-like protein [Pseudorhodoferax soli]
MLPPWLGQAVGPVLVIVLVLALAVLAVATDHVRSRERALVGTQNLARLIEAQLSDNFDKIDIYLQLVALRHGSVLQGGGADPGGTGLQVQPRMARVALDDVAIADADGAVRLRTASLPAPLAQVGAQEFFRRAVAEPRGALVVVVGPVPGGPAGAQDGASRIVFARAVRDARGTLRGVVFAGMSGAQFDQLFEGIDFGVHGAASLRTEDLQAVHYHPATQGAPAGVSDGLRRAVRVAPAQGSYEAAGTVDGHQRLNAYRRLRDHPFYVVVGQSMQDAMAGWRANTLMVAALAALTIVLTLWAWLMLVRSSRRQLRALHNRFEAIVQSSSDSIVSKTLQGHITTWNRGAQQMFGYTEAEMRGQSAVRLAPTDRQGEDAALIARVRRGESLQDYETQRLRKDGTLIDVSMAVSPVLDARGRIAGISVIARDISRHKAMEVEIRSMAFNDPLTRLPNRRLLMDRLRQAQLSSSRQRSYFGVLFIDLDGFKRINDSFGHEAGDQMLIEVGRRLQAAVRQHDTVARLGGDEFVVLLEELGVDEKTAADHVNTVADKILDAIERNYHLRGETHRCSASIGIRLLVGSQESPEQVLMDADAAMYSVKRQRRALRTFAFE